jgi:para-nitrobenzyl esterase
MCALVFGCATVQLKPASETFRPSVWEGDSLVLTRYGYVKGFEDSGDTWVWRGIPFADPPTAQLRWKAPREPHPWEGVRKARNFCQPCTQLNPIFPGRINGTEDCLYLNVWRPQSGKTGLPVYVWIHGGGNSIGSAFMISDYYGHALASESDMVFVSVNYRLGPFGWLSHPALEEGLSLEDDSGNYGTLDLIRALSWIQENIGAFGGDPGNVTIAGESAGGMNVLSLMISPLAKGLFSRAICQSGSPSVERPEESEKAAESMLIRLLVRDGTAATDQEAEEKLAAMGRREIRTFLRSKTDRDILRSLPPTMLGMVDNPSILTDGFVIPGDGYGVFDTGEYHKVPLIIGSNLEENKLFLNFDSRYSWESDLYQAIARYGSMLWKAAGVDGTARRLAVHADQPGVYAYLFAWGAPDAAGRSPLPGNWGRRLGAFHSLEIPFFLGTDTIFGRYFTPLLFTPDNRPGREALSSAMMKYLAAFARTGDPKSSESHMPLWEKWSNVQGGFKSIVFDGNEKEPFIRMSQEETTRKSVFESAAAELEASLQDTVMSYLEDFHGFLEED